MRSGASISIEALGSHVYGSPKQQVTRELLRTTPEVLAKFGAVYPIQAHVHPLTVILQDNPADEA